MTVMANNVFDFGSGHVPAHQHPNGGGWVADSARVSETAYIGNNARVSDNAWVYGNARVYDNAWVYGNAWVYDGACVSANARVRSVCTITPIVVSSFEYGVTVCDTIAHIGCKDVSKDDYITADMFPEEHCPRLRAAAEHIIGLMRFHWNEVKS